MYLLKYWKIILPSIAVLLFVWWVRGVISDRDEALADLAVANARNKQLELSIGKQNTAIAGLANSYKDLTEEILGVEEEDGKERKRLNRIVKQVDEAVDALINAPAVAAELACEAAGIELKDTKGAKDLLNPTAD
jgi:hypothetical protein